MRTTNALDDDDDDDFRLQSLFGIRSFSLRVRINNWIVDLCGRIGPGLAFVAYPEGIAMMPIAPFWSVMFFVMLFTLGVDSQFAMIETGVTAIVDEFHFLRKGRRKVGVVGVVCVVLFLLGLPQCSSVRHHTNITYYSIYTPYFCDPRDSYASDTLVRGSVVRTSVFGWQTFPDLCLIYG